MEGKAAAPAGAAPARAAAAQFWSLCCEARADGKQAAAPLFSSGVCAEVILILSQSSKKRQTNSACISK